MEKLRRSFRSSFRKKNHFEDDENTIRLAFLPGRKNIIFVGLRLPTWPNDWLNDSIVFLPPPPPFIFVPPYPPCFSGSGQA